MMLVPSLTIANLLTHKVIRHSWGTAISSVFRESTTVNVRLFLIAKDLIEMLRVVNAHY